MNRERLWEDMVERERENETESEGANERRSGKDCGGCSEMFFLTIGPWGSPGSSALSTTMCPIAR